jgi:two-component sensor histidine kinase
MGLAGITPGTIRSRLLLVVLAALLPATVLGVRQTIAIYDHSRLLANDRIKAKAAAVAESERDPFILARHALISAGQMPAVRNMTANCNEALRIVAQGAEGVINLSRTDARGNVQCSALPFERGTDASHRQWWIEARNRHGRFATPPQFGLISGRPVLGIVEALRRQNEQFDGTLVASLSLEQLADALQRQQAGSQAAIIIANRQGIPILQAPQGKFRALPGVVSALASPVESVAADGGKWTIATAPLFENDIFVAYAEPSQSLAAVQFSEARSALVLQLLTLMLTSLAIWFGAQRLILHWLDLLQRLAGRFTRGDFTDPASYAGAPLEFAQLADRLHDMAAAIEEHDKELREALVVETALTREVHHRVKNNLQIITSLLSLQCDRISDPVARNALGLARTRIGTLGLIHRLLYQEKTGAEQGTVYLPQLFVELCIQLRAANVERRGISLECSASDGTISVDQAVPLTLFIVEAVSNAFQHAFADGRTGNVWAELLIEADQAVLTVRDDGNGIEEAGGKPQMGFDLMQAFSIQLGGITSIAQSKAGTVVTLGFTLTKPGP